VTPGARSLIGILALAAVTAGCGKKGPPLAPLRRAPARVEDFTARRLASDVHLQLTVPSRNSDGSAPADLGTVEIYAFTDDPAQPPLANRMIAERATLVAAFPIRPPDPPEGETPAPAPVQMPPDQRPAQGGPVSAVETITEETLQPLSREEPRRERRREAPAPEPAEPIVPPLGIPDAGPTLVRFYVARGVSAKNQAGPFSARRVVPLGPAPDRPPATEVTYTPAAILVGWESPASAPRRLQQPAEPGMLESRPVLAQQAPYRYNVYEVSAPAAPAKVGPLNEQPLETGPYEDTRLAYGVQRCYVVRTVRTLAGALLVESEPTDPVCVTPSDTFAPAAPTGLAAVSGEGAISLIWEANAEADLAGYLILRGESPGETLQALTPEPVRDTTYRDTSVRPGVRYVYAVVAVDTATPRNVSPQSNRVEETAR
jgi:hypothetical protein